jgi:hypothetical protein
LREIKRLPTNSRITAIAFNIISLFLRACNIRVKLNQSR